MDSLLRMETVSEYNALNNNETLHPLVSVIDFSLAKPRRLKRTYFGFYLVLLKDTKCGDLRYGKNTYDYQEGTLVFFGPGQILEIEPKEDLYQPAGYGVVFHPDLILGTPLGKTINGYSFFSYDLHEALHISERERQIILDCFSKISYELEHAVDKHSKKLIASNIELLLNYCDRFYDRQFITRDNSNKGVIERFEKLLNEYFSSDRPIKNGLPSVAFFAEELHLSPNYFGDLMKKETGKSAQDHIQSKLIGLAKEHVLDPEKSISQVAYELGFKYPQHFSRMFKGNTGVTPNEYRNMN